MVRAPENFRCESAFSICSGGFWFDATGEREDRVVSRRLDTADP